MVKRIGLAVLIAVSLLTHAGRTPGALAAEATLEMTFTSNRDKATIGDEIILTVEVMHGGGYKLLPLPERFNFPPFEIKRVEALPSVKKGSTVTEGFKIVLTTFELGTFKIPRFAIAYQDPQGKPGQMLTDEVRVDVVSVGRRENDTNDIRPIKKPFVFHPKGIPAELVPFGWGLVALLALIAIVFLRIRLKKLKRRPLTPYESAVKRMTKLKKAKFETPEEMRFLYEEISDLLRHYFILQYQVGEMDQTSKEFLRALGTKHFVDDTLIRLKQILYTADLVKFARYAPSAPEAAASLRMTEEVIQMNRPPEDEEKERKKGGA